MFFSRQETITWPAMFKRVREQFPEVPQMSTEELAARLLWTTDRPVLLDVRDADEVGISQIPGARHVPPESNPEEVLADLGKEQSIVVYCASGVRSSKFARRMIRGGFTAVANLEGSIFKWANEGRPIVVDGRPANKVHACDERWAVLLNPELRVIPPESS